MEGRDYCEVNICSRKSHAISGHRETKKLAITHTNAIHITNTLTQLAFKINLETHQCINEWGKEGAS